MVLKTDKAPAPVGPYSQAIQMGDWVFCSGQIPLDAVSGELITGDVQKQTHKIMENIGEVLKSADLNFSHIVKSTIFLTDMGQFSQVNEVYASYFALEPPARSCVEVSALPKGVNVEIEVVAHR